MWAGSSLFTLGRGSQRKELDIELINMVGVIGFHGNLKELFLKSFDHLFHLLEVGCLDAHGITANLATESPETLDQLLPLLIQVFMELDEPGIAGSGRHLHARGCLSPTTVLFFN